MAAHPPGVGYSSTPAGASGFKSPPAAAAPAAATTPPAAAAAAPAPSNASSSAPDPVANMGSFSPGLPSFVKEPMFIAVVLILGLIVYGKYVKPINLGLGGLAKSSNPSVQSYIDQQNRKVALTTDTMPGRIMRANPSKLA